MPKTAEIHHFSYGQFVWFQGVVEKIKDPKKTGRVKVRCFGYHTDKLDKIPTDDLPWSMVMQGTDNSGMSGIGQSHIGIKNGSHVVGFFMDGTNAQQPVIMGVISSISNDPANSSKGFYDPDEEWPRKPYLGESDINRLARNEKINETIVPGKKDNVKESATAFGVEWKEPKTEYDAKYLKNRVYESDSGHITEIDDTPGAERIHQWHRKGTFTEIHPDGSEVTKIVKDKYMIIAKDDHVHIEGDSHITVDGDAHILVKGDSNIETKGDHTEQVDGNYNLTIDGNMIVKVKGFINMKTESIFNLTVRGLARFKAAMIYLN